MAAGYFSNDILAEILKRLPIESVNRFKLVQKSWYHLIRSPYFKALYSRNHRFVYMLVSRAECGYALYRFHPLDYLQYNSDSTNLQDLQPLLVFPETKPYDLRCIKLGSKIYILGLPNYIAPYTQNIPKQSVYTIDEGDLLDIKPSEDNIIINFKHIFTKTNPMHGHKYCPTVFVANNKLYVLSDSCWKDMFEVFSPVDQSWQVLPPLYDVGQEFWASFRVFYFVVVEQEQMVYFATSISVVSFNLTTHKWSIHSKTPVKFSQKGNRGNSICVPIIREMAFCFLHKSGVNDLCASRSFSRGEELMQPYLAPDKAFMEVLTSSRFTYICKDYDSEYIFKDYSEYIIVLQDSDGTQVLCIVTYGNISLENGGSVDIRTNYVALSFFDIPGDFYTSKDRPLQKYAIGAFYTDEKTEDGGVVRRYFNAKFRYTKHFAISTPEYFSEIVTCIL